MPRTYGRTGSRLLGAALMAVIVTVAAAGCVLEESGPEPHLQRGAPAAKTLRFHQLTLPPEASALAHVEDNGWSSYALALTFRIPEHALPGFLRKIHVTRRDLQPGFYGSDVDSALTGWKKRPGRTYLSATSNGSAPPATTYTITLDTTDKPDRITVYLTSLSA